MRRIPSRDQDFLGFSMFPSCERGSRHRTRITTREHMSFLIVPLDDFGFYLVFFSLSLFKGGSFLGYFISRKIRGIFDSIRKNVWIFVISIILLRIILYGKKCRGSD